MDFKYAIGIYKNLIQEWTDIGDAIKTLEAAPSKPEDTGIALKILRIEKDKMDEKISEFEKTSIHPVNYDDVIPG